MRARSWIVIAASVAWASADGPAAAKDSSALGGWAQKNARSSDEETRLRAYRQLWELGARVPMPKRDGACQEIEATDPSTCRERLKVCLSTFNDYANNLVWLAKLTPVPSSTRTTSVDPEDELSLPIRVDAFMSSKACAEGAGRAAPFHIAEERRRAERAWRRCMQDRAREEALNSGPLCRLVSVEPCRGLLGLVCNVPRLGNYWYMNGAKVPSDWQADELSFGWSEPAKTELTLRADDLEGDEDQPGGGW
jgi:hypothetical protein